MNDTSRQNLVNELLADALELPANQRRAFILNNCHDPAILEETLTLIEHAPELDEEDSARRTVGRATGDRIGPYLVQWMLGEGTFGEVYLAVREDLGQRVAVKLLRSAVDAEEQARFETEARLLASLEHPNITRLIDYGRSAKGQPYLVMELAEGGTLKDWVEQENPSQRALLLLFLKICDAVQLAHSNLIIHRDIKPSNILMDSRGEPKLADFGIVQMIGTLAAVTPAASQPAVLGGTMAFASPELFKGSPLTTSSDVFSLGVMLRELCKQGGSEEAMPAELAAIVSRCMDKNPRARYANAGELRDEIQAYLEHRPTKAGSHDWMHLARLFTLRNQAAVVAATVAFVLLSMALLWIARQNLTLEQTTKVLHKTLDEKNRQVLQAMEMADHLDQVQSSQFLENWNGFPDPHQVLSDDARAARRDASLEARFHLAACERELGQMLLDSNGKAERVQGMRELKLARKDLQRLHDENPKFHHVDQELRLVDDLLGQENNGIWSGPMGFAAERVPPRLGFDWRSTEALSDARSARALGDLWRSLNQPAKAKLAYNRAIQLFARAAAGGEPEAAAERIECTNLSRSL